MGEGAYEAEVAAWRAEREASFRRSDGWLSQIALHWLEGDCVELEIGTFTHTDRGMRFVAHGGVEITLAGAAVRDALLRDDAPDSPDVLSAGSRSYQVVRRGAALGVRVRDSNAPGRTSFRGLSWYPVRPEWRITGRLVRSASPAQVVMHFTAGQEEDAQCPGYVELTALGREHRLVPYVRPDGSWLFVFRDETNVDATCALCRYFYCPAADADGRVVLDFNRAAAPICAFVPFVTCVLPPPENRLAVRVEAGELRYDGDEEGEAHR